MKRLGKNETYAVVLTKSLKDVSSSTIKLALEVTTVVKSASQHSSLRRERERETEREREIERERERERERESEREKSLTQLQSEC